MLYLDDISDGQNGFRRRKKVRFPHWYGLQFEKKNGSPN